MVCHSLVMKYSEDQKKMDKKAVHSKLGCNGVHEKHQGVGGGGAGLPTSGGRHREHAVGAAPDRGGQPPVAVRHLQASAYRRGRGGWCCRVP